jgi:hypothetical protein
MSGKCFSHQDSIDQDQIFDRDVIAMKKFQSGFDEKNSIKIRLKIKNQDPVVKR